MIVCRSTATPDSISPVLTAVVEAEVENVVVGEYSIVVGTDIEGVFVD